jgi:uncharacterized OB-fold protein
MDDFFSYLKKGKFRIPACIQCRRTVWPPSKFCSLCLGEVRSSRARQKGVVIDYTCSHIGRSKGTVGLVELRGVRLLGSIVGKPVKRGAKVMMASCGITPEGSVFYNFKVIKQTMR